MNQFYIMHSSVIVLSLSSELTVERLKSFIPQLLSRLHIEFLIYGNITKQVGRDRSVQCYVLNAVTACLRLPFGSTGDLYCMYTHERRGSVVVSTSACHAARRGSLPDQVHY